MLGIAHFTASQPGVVKLMPQMGGVTFALFLAGGIWLALWRGKPRLLGFVLAALGAVLLALTPVPDLLISGDGRNVGITGEGHSLLVLRQSRSDYTREILMELAGVEGEPAAMADWDGANCSADFCTVTLKRAGREWHVLMSRSDELVTERALAAACESADIVVADRWLPQSCVPRWIKADRRMLEETGGLAITLEGSLLRDGPQMLSVSDIQGEHGWWRGRYGD